MKRILWISNYAPIKACASAGSQTFHYYFKAFNEDSQFDLRLISCSMYKNKTAIEQELSSVEKSIIYWNNPNENKVKKILNVESKYNPLNRYANLISNTTVISIFKTLRKWKSAGYQPDVVILEWTNMLMLVKKVKQTFPACKVVASEHDVTFVGYDRKRHYYKGLKKISWNFKFKWEKYIELKALNLCDMILPQNPDNIKLLLNEGIDSSKVRWLVPYFNNMSGLKRNSQNKDILFYGAMSRPENYLSAIWFINEVLPKLKDLNIRFVVLGSNPPKELLSYESEFVHVTGFVKDISSFFTDSLCFVAPLVLGAGIKVKILEALSSGIPVLTNNIGIEGIPAENGRNYVLCTSPKEYEIAIRRSTNGELEELGKKGKDFITNNYNIEVSAENYKSMIYGLGE